MRWRWLLVLPVALALVTVATASRLQIFWWPEQLHDVTAGTQGEPLAITDEWEDEEGGTQRRELTVTLVEVLPATQVEGFGDPEPLVRPAGSNVWQVKLHFEVDPDVPLGGCQVSIIDTGGREAKASYTSLGEATIPDADCAPEDRSGPQYDGSTLEGELPRPSAYDVSVLVVTDDEAVPELVRLWWEAPDVAELTLSGD